MKPKSKTNREPVRQAKEASAGESTIPNLETGRGLSTLIVDDHAIIRDGLWQILQTRFPEAILGQAANATEALAEVEKREWQVILLDISMPGQSGLDILKQIKLLQPETRLLVLTMHPEEHYAMRVLKAGASGYLTKEKASAELVDAIKKVMAGGKYVSLNFADKLVAGLDKPSQKAPHETLSDREYQVMRMIASGKNLKEIAFDLKLSIKTISTYRSRVLTKLNLESNAHIIRYALRENLVQ